MDEANRSEYADAILEQCEFMPGMAFCDTYFGEQQQAESDAFSMVPDEDAPLASSPQVVELQDGDTYTITIDEVKKKIG